MIDDDAVSVRRIGRRGGVLTAKLALSEFAGGGRPRNPGASMHGQGRNPWDRTRYSGGSSSGSGIAVALGLVPFALGTETGGSILGPSAFSGVTGLRPTFDLIPTDGVMVLSWTLDKVGPLARSAEDCATALAAMAGSRFRPMSWPEIDDTARRVRVAWLDVELEEAAPEVREPVGAGAAAFRRLVGSTVEIGIDRRLPYIDALEDIVRVEGGFERRDLLRDPTFEMSDARQLATLRSGLDVPSADYLSAVRATVPATRAAFDSVFEHADVILSASRTTIAPSLTEERPPRDATKMSDLLRAAGNLAGVPGVSFPCGLSANGMPVGLQIVGPRGSDALLLGLAAAFQRATDHHLRRPPEPA